MSGVPFGDYRLLRRLGAGGMAEVFLARREGPAGFRKHLVIKRILPHLARSESFVRMFLHEARVAALIDHPNLAHVSAFGEIAGEYYMAMEYVDGFTLVDLLGRVGTCTPGVAGRIATDVLEALHAIHSARGPDRRPLGLVHRDVSLRNVMVTREGAVKLLDFGIAVGRNEPSPRRMGTRRFMSPEQADGAPQDARSDLYLVALLIHTLVAAGPRADKPHERPSAMPHALWSTVAAALHPDPARRPASAWAMKAKLEMFLASRGAEGTRTHLASLVDTVFPPDGAPPVAAGPPVATAPVTAADTAGWRRDETGARPLVWAGAVAGMIVVGLMVWFAIGRSSHGPGGDRSAEWAPVRQAALQAARPAGPESRTPGDTAVSTSSSGAPGPSPVGGPRLRRVGSPRLRRVGSPRLRRVGEELSGSSVAQEMPVSGPAASKSRPRRTPGRLTIDTRPWTEVYIGERRLGMTPLTGVRLPAGQHELRLINAQQGLDTTITVRIRSGRETRVLRAL